MTWQIVPYVDFALQNLAHSWRETFCYISLLMSLWAMEIYSAGKLQSSGNLLHQEEKKKINPYFPLDRDKSDKICSILGTFQKNLKPKIIRETHFIKLPWFCR